MGNGPGAAQNNHHFIRGSYSRNADGGYEGGAHPPPPPPPPPPAPAPAPRPTPITPASAQPWLTVAPPALNRPRTGYILVSLAIYNGYPFKDHWAFFLRQSSSASNGILVHAEGNVRDGFIFEIKRNHDFAVTGNVPALIDLHWVDGRFFNQGMWNNGHHRVERPGVPTCPFELSVARAPAPRRSLNPVEERAPTPARPARIRQRNCQTWIVEAGAMLVQDQMIPEDVLEYLLAIKQ
ncbi:hypothetical protein QBC40DRAFT_318501 [Triangularia verruculosa]|uniref:Uncharacterized protein n=1 Tax=Triangularia verruculosa TaxID=2587418 RepID=A0AAN7AVW0_9PEZI|nr:hypothetical protein QBC40DRAFT_318501 [Triangularia verruculosa]